MYQGTIGRSWSRRKPLRGRTALWFEQATPAGGGAGRFSHEQQPPTPMGRRRPLGALWRSGALGLAAQLLGFAFGFQRWRVNHVADAALDRTLGLMDCTSGLTLGLAGGLLGRAFGFECVVASQLAGDLLQATLD